MKRLYLFLAFALHISFALCQNILAGKVVRVADGDTITILDDDNTQIKIRLYGIDCPESCQDFGTVAKKFWADRRSN